MRTQTPLPRMLGTRFTVREAAGAGVPRRRRDAADLARPFHGIRVTADAAAFDDLVKAYAPRLAPDQRFGGKTAARLWRMPIPAAWEEDETLHVFVPTNGSRPRTAGVSGLRLAPERLNIHRIDGVPVLDPVATLFTCAKSLTLLQAVTLIDAILTTANNYPALRQNRPLVMIEDIAERLAVWRRFPGCGIIRKALDLARYAVESPKETETRLLLREHGLPEPVVQYRVLDGFRLVARTDLAYPELKIAIEYEGDGHRTSAEQWRRDIQRQRELEALGWIVIRLTQEDLNDADTLIDRIRGAIASRSV